MSSINLKKTGKKQRPCSCPGLHKSFWLHLLKRFQAPEKIARFSKTQRTASHLMPWQFNKMVWQLLKKTHRLQSFSQFLNVHGSVTARIVGLERLEILTKKERIMTRLTSESKCTWHFIFESLSLRISVPSVWNEHGASQEHIYIVRMIIPSECAFLIRSSLASPVSLDTRQTHTIMTCTKPCQRAWGWLV